MPVINKNTLICCLILILSPIYTSCLQQHTNISPIYKTPANKLYNVIILAGVYVIAPFLLISVYIQPAGDDYFSAVRDEHTAFIPVLQDSYLHWSGRYFAIAISRINPLLFHSVVAYKWYAAILIILFVKVLFILVRQVAGKYLTIKQVAAITIIFTTMYFAAMPSVSEGFYWFSGAWVYQAANIMFVLLLAVLIKLKQVVTALARMFYFICAIILSLCIIGCNEISLIITCLCILFFTWHVYRRRMQATRYFFTLAVICFIAAAIAGLAPGNFERLNHQQEYSASLVWTFGGGLSITVVYLLQWLVQVLIASFIYIPLCGNPLAKKMNDDGACYSVKLKRVIIFFIITFFIIQLFTVWAAGGSNAGRIENVIYLFFILGYFFILQLYLVQRVSKSENTAVNFHPLLFKIAVVLFFINMLDVNNNISTAWLDVVSGKSAKYNAEQNERVALAKHCIKDTCLVAPLSTLPKTIFFADIKCIADSTDLWTNQAYSRYYGKGYILVNAPLPQVQSNMETLKNLGREMRENVFKK